jgi:hypothetical protein
VCEGTHIRSTGELSTLSQNTDRNMRIPKSSRR